MKNFFKHIILLAITAEAKAVVRRYRPHIVAVTGSVGKTSTKDAIYEVIAHGTRVRKSQKSFNSELGLPLTILGRPNAWSNPVGWIQNLLDGLFLVFFKSPYPDWLVLEVGADRPGDIQSVASWLPVDIAVITRLPEMPVHVEFFSSPEQVVEEKAALIDAIKEDGTLVLYADDARAADMRLRATGKHIVTFGFTKDVDVRAQNFTILYKEGDTAPTGMSAEVVSGGNSAPVEVLGTVGKHTLLPVLAAVAVGKVLGKNMTESIQALQKYATPPGRMRLLPGIKGSTIIDDTYNASPAAVSAALETLALVAPRGRKIAVIGDMLELGRHSVDEHRKLGTEAAATTDILITIGFRARDIAQGALDANMPESAIFQYEDAERAGDELAAMIRQGDTVLVKGSQSMRMERTVKEIMAEPERASELLVRQDEEWIKR